MTKILHFGSGVTCKKGQDCYTIRPLPSFLRGALFIRFYKHYNNKGTTKQGMDCYAIHPLFLFFMVLFCQLHQFFVFTDDVGVVFRAVRHGALRAILALPCQVPEVAAAFIAQRIERTIAEQAVEAVRIVRFMAGEKLAVFIIEEAIAVIHYFFRFFFALRRARMRFISL